MGGLEAIRGCFTGLFQKLDDLSELSAPVIDVEEGSAAGGRGHVFLTWKCPSSGVAHATDTFIFDENDKIVRQNVVLQTMTPTAGKSGGASTTASWDNHFAAFGAQDVDKI